MSQLILVSTFVSVIASAAIAATTNEETSQIVVSSGEVLGSRAVVQPVLGWELLVRHNGNLFICSVKLEEKFGYNGAPNVPYVAAPNCVDSNQEIEK